MSTGAAVTASAAGKSPNLSGLLDDNSWKPHLADEFNKPYLHKLDKFIKNEWATQQVFPAPSMIFRFWFFAHPVHPFMYVPFKLIVNLVQNWLKILRWCVACRAFNTCPFDDVKVVILGQDPYHNVNQAMGKNKPRVKCTLTLGICMLSVTGLSAGLSFSVPAGQPVPSSLNNIYKEIATDCGCTKPRHGSLLKVQGLKGITTAHLLERFIDNLLKGWCSL